MKYVRFKLSGSRCLTSCPYISDKSVFSNYCKDCKHYKGFTQKRNEETEMIESCVKCGFEEGAGILSQIQEAR